MLSNIYISRKTRTPIMISRAAQNLIVLTPKHHEILLCIIHKRLIIKNNTVPEHVLGGRHVKGRKWNEVSNRVK
jgi:hypothetical protein